MSKGALSFTLPEEESEFRRALMAGDMASAMWDLDQWLREKVRYVDMPDAEKEIYVGVRDQFRTLCGEAGVGFVLEGL